MNKSRLITSGFTLIELLIAIIIMGVLFAISVPLYLEHAERAKGSKALETLQQIYNAQVIFAVENEGFSGDINVLRTFAPIAPDDNDWTYGFVGVPTQTTFTAIATRTIATNPTYNNRTITIDQDHNIVGLPYP